MATDGVDVEPTALAVRELETVGIARDPAAMLIDVRKAAAALMQMIDADPHKLMFNGEQYIENQHWQLAGHFYQVTAKIVEDRFVTYGEASGWEATAVATDRTGREIGRAISMCLNDEENWRARPKYDWVYICKDGRRSLEDPGKDEIVWEENPKKPGSKRPKKERLQTGIEPVPLFQLRSMAQTRAHSKALSQVLKFVPVLAGYQPTPAEELPVERVEREQAPPPRRKPAATITAAQRTRLFAIAKEVGWSKEELKVWLASHGYESSSDIPMLQYDRIVGLIQQGGDEPRIDAEPAVE